MTDQLKTVIARIEKLPQAQQDSIIQCILDKLDDEEWDIILNSSKGQAALHKLVAEARQEIARGQAEEIQGDTFDS